MSIKKLAFLVGLLLLSARFASAIEPMQPIAPQQSTAAEGSHIFVGKNITTIAMTWNAAVTARYLIIFDATTLPGNGAISSCSSSHVTGCWLWCSFIPTSTSAPQRDTEDWTVHPLAGTFGIVAAMSTGAGCGTLTTDGANDFFTAQVR